MAIANPEHSASSVVAKAFDVITAQINSVFDRILREVEARRDQLLSEVDKKKREIELKNSALIESVREMEKMRSQLANTSLKLNIALEQKQDSIDDINTKIEELESEVDKSIQLEYSCCLDQLIQQIKQFGEIIDKTGNLALARSKYSKKLTAVKVIDININFRNIFFSVNVKVHVDSEKQLLYVMCLENKNEFMVYNANDFSFMTSYGDSKYPPKCIATSKDYIYIGSTNKLLRYSSTDLSLLNVIQQSDTVCAITVSEEDNVIVLDINGRISIYDITLNLRVEIYSGFTRKLLVSTPIMVTRNNKMFVLYDEKLTLHESLIDWSTDSFYFKDSEGGIPNVKSPSAFCIDQAGNFIVADAADQSIKIISPEGDLVHTIGGNTEGCANIPRCCGITVYKNSIFVACCEEGQYQIRLY